MQLRQYEYSDHLIEEFNKKEYERLDHLYDNEPHRKPKIYDSVNTAIGHVKDKIEDKHKHIQLVERSNRRLNIADAADLIIDNIAMTVIPSEDDEDSANLAIYDYDRSIYVMSYMHLNKYLVAILGSTSRSQVDSLIQTIVSRENELCYYNPLPKYKIAVGNGIFNCLTKRLEEFTPLYTVLTRIKTNYIENAQRPYYNDHFTLEGMISDFADNNPDRIELLTQIVKSILTGVNRSDVFFIVIGPGGDGKSTTFTMITNIIGNQNASYLNFSEIMNPDKLLTTLNKKIMLGMDNDVNLYIKKTALLKSMASHENITLQRKYMSSISVEFSPVIVQLCNEMPRFAETQESMRRRIVTFKSENSHYRNGTQNNNVKKYIQDSRFLEYALWYFLNEDITPYYNDYNEVDREVSDESLNNDDIIGQFVNDMRVIGYINEINRVLPLRHLYALYLDWFNENNPGSKPLGMRAFKLKISPELEKSGYSFDPYNKHRRVRSLKKDKLYFTHMLGDYTEGYETQHVIDNNNQVKCFELTHEPQTGLNERVLRASHPVNVITYFDLMNDILNFAKRNNMEDEIKLINQQQPIKIKENIEKVDHSNSDPQKIFKAITFGNIDDIDKIIEMIEQSDDQDVISQVASSIIDYSTQSDDIMMLTQAKSVIDDNQLNDKKENILRIIKQIRENVES